jgi:transposase InsO family protein
MTHISADEAWLNLANVLDLGSRRIVGYAMDGHMRTELVSRTLSMKVVIRCGDVKNIVLHHDRGSQYVSCDLRELFARNCIPESVGCTESCNDNVVAESLWETMRRESVHRCRFASRGDEQPPDGSIAKTQFVSTHQSMGVTIHSASNSRGIEICPESAGRTSVQCFY